MHGAQARSMDFQHWENILWHLKHSLCLLLFIVFTSHTAVATRVI